ncbi:MAG: YlbE-like family protein [Sporolactobacillus sp.]
MRKEIQQYLDQHPDEKLFVRLHPDWYRRLSRAPADLRELKPAAKVFYGRTFQQRLERFNERASMVSMLMSMAQAMDISRGSEKDKS